MGWVIRTQRLGLRRLATDDLPRLCEMPWLDAERVLRRSLEEYERVGHAFWAVEVLEDRMFAGVCGLLAQLVEGESELEVAYHVLESLRGRGIATEAARGIMDYAFGRLGVQRLVSLIEPDNAASIAVAGKNGLVFERNAIFRGIPVCVYVAVAAGAAC